MRTGAGLALICVGAILAFAVTTNTSVFNLHTAGWVMIIIGIIGLFIPRRTYGWLNSRVVRRTRFYPGGRRVEEIAVPPYVGYNPGTSRIRAGLPPRPTLLTEPLDDDPHTGPGHRPPADGETEVVEDLYEGP
jgi:hypothetical protein